MVPPSVSVLGETLINDSTPFYIYHLEISFLDSTHIIYRQFPQFVQLQKKLLNYRDVSSNKDERVTLEECLPKLKAGGLLSYFESVDAQAKREAESIKEFSTELIKLVISGLFDLKEKFVKKICSFFELGDCVKKRRGRGPENKNLLINYDILTIPQTLISHILTFLPKRDLVAVSLTCKELNNLAMNPFLWKHINLRARSNIVDDNFVEKLTKKFTQITSIDMSYCDEIGCNTALAISQNCSPQYLRELNLDGCKKITDHALKHLVLKFMNEQPSEQSQEALEVEQECINHENSSPEFTTKDSLESIQPSSIEKKINHPEEIQSSKFTYSKRKYRGSFDSIHDERMLKGGTRGLKKISLSECKHVTDKGMISVAKITSLNSLSLLSCHHITDKGVCWLLERCKDLEEINLGGTQITVKTLEYIRNECPRLRRVSLVGCSEINEADALQLEEKEIEVEYGEGTCKFFLIPENGLPSISNNSYKGRTTLSIHRLQNFVKEKLKTIGKEITDLELLYEKKVLEEHFTLQDIQAFHPRKEELIVTYRKKRHFMKKFFASGQPRPWTCRKEVCECLNPECKQTFDILHPKLNCYSCGGVFCGKCTQYKTPIRRLGYDDPMRVCILCWLANKERD